MNLEPHINSFEKKPYLLSQSNIPKPLHNVNPRTIMGREKWDSVRQDVYKSTNYHCAACGVSKYNALFHKWLEAHENYKIDHEKAIVEVISIEPLCHACHSFVHSGFLTVQYRKGTKSKDQINTILEHGFTVLWKAKLPAFVGLLGLMQEVSFPYKWGGEWLHPKPSSKSWSDWRLIWNGKEYGPKYKSIFEWERAMK